METRISVDPNIHFGKPCVTGTRLPVQNVLELIREGMVFEEIIRDYYPDLEQEDIRACIQGEDELRKAFVVVEPGQHRFRRLPE